MAKILTEVIKCALCGKESEQKYIASSIFVEDQDLDTRPYGMSRGLLKYEIQACPHCGYVNYYIDENPNNMKLFDCTTSTIGPSEIASNYIKFARQFERLDNWADAGNLYLKAAWIFDDLNNEEWAIKMRTESARCFKIHVDNTEDGEVAMILVDIYRRSKYFEDALSIIKRIGDTGYEDYNSILKYQIDLCLAKDSSIHLMKEAVK